MLFKRFQITVLVCSGFIFAITGCSKKDALSGLSSINSENIKAVGASANDLLSAAKYSSVKIEIQYMPGFQPTAATISNLTSYLNSLVNKPGGISVIQTQIPSAGNAVLSLTDIGTIEKNNRTVYTSGNQLGVYFLFTDGVYSENNVLGLAYRNTSMCFFGKTIHDNSGGLNQAGRAVLETTVLEHEFGHILGLVDLGTVMQTNHKDAAHGNHCTNINCLMYFDAQTTGGLGVLLAGSIPLPDANCLADLKANGGK